MTRISMLFLSLTMSVILGSSCRKSFLDVQTAGELNDYQMANPKGIEELLVGAYSMLPGDKTWNWYWEAASSNWLWGSIRGMEANHGSDAGDETDIGSIQNFSETPYMTYLNPRWRSIYEGVSRCNNAIRVIKLALSRGAITFEQEDLFLRQARVLRGWYHFEAWRMWEKVPYLDENTDPINVTNTTDIRGRIIADLTEGTGLSLNMGAIGKFNRTVSQVLLGKALMQMYHNYKEALPILQDAAINGRKANGTAIGLAPTYGEIFDLINRNGIESIYTIQYSVNDGSGGKNGGDGEVLNFPYKGKDGSPAGCCGFFDPTQEFVNSFRTSSGLPLLNDLYDTPAQMVTNDEGVPPTNIWSPAKNYDRDIIVTIIDTNEVIEHYYKSLISNDSANFPPSSPGEWLYVMDWTPYQGEIDPRLDWSVGRKSIPYWDWGKHSGSDWIRDQLYTGPYNPKKQVYKKSQEGIYTETGNWTSGWTANGYRMIRYADLLLLIAECQVENDDLEGARTNINLVRARAANPEGFVMDDGVPAANYSITTYPGGGVYPFDNQENARKALYMERKLELGQEGHRYFDLKRWGITVTELNRALDYEKSMPWGRSLYGNAVVGPEDTIYPIPQRQIDLSHGNLVQNR